MYQIIEDLKQNNKSKCIPTIIKLLNYLKGFDYDDNSEIFRVSNRALGLKSC